MSTSKGVSESGWKVYKSSWADNKDLQSMGNVNLRAGVAQVDSIPDTALPPQTW